MATGYFLSSVGNDGGSGSREAPWLTLAKANATLQPGDTVTVLDGKHSGVIEPAQSGKEDAPITYRAESRLGAVLTGGEATDKKRLCVSLTDREHIVVEGFHMLPESGGWMRLEGTYHCVIRNCRMENATKSGSPIHCKDSHYFHSRT